MNPTIRLLAFAGSGRRDSINRKLLAAAVARARARGAEVTVLDLRADTLPLYDGDLEDAGMPAKVGELRALFAAHDGLLIASPEYNSFITPLMKNTLDWLSRPAPPGVTDWPEPFAGKVAAIVSTSPGALGGIRAMPWLRLLLLKLGVVVSPTDLAVGHGDQTIGDGELKDPRQQAALDRVVAELLTLTQAIKTTR